MITERKLRQLSPTRRYRERPCLSRIMLRAACSAPSKVVSELKRSAKINMPESAQSYIDDKSKDFAVIDFADKWVVARDAGIKNPKIEFLVLSADFWLSAIIAIARKTEDKRHDPDLASGLLEDFLGKHGEGYIDIIAEISRKWPRFRHLLGGVWKGNMKKGIWHRIEAIRGTPW